MASERLSSQDLLPEDQRTPNAARLPEWDVLVLLLCISLNTEDVCTTPSRYQLSPKAFMDYSSLDPSDIKRTCLLPTPSPLQAHYSIPQLLLSLSPRAGEQDIRTIPYSSYCVSLIFLSPED